MSGQTLIIILLVGLIAGWLAGQIVQGTGFGLIADIAIGIVGALIGAWLLPHLHIHLGNNLSGRNRLRDNWSASASSDPSADLPTRTMVT